uniref:Uncharacterized protein n=1 Tax=Ananas comosus var. bracteatus TaxID=296719 RepID=A0A6V7Q6T6_ANACO|nr:unnamed protein product [Ananas comosus var. bracteatus]
MLGVLSLVISVLAAIALVSLLALHGQSRKVLCSFATTIFLICITKSVEFMPFSVSLFVFLCGTSYVVHLLGRDPFVAVPNGCGSLLGALQLILYAIYRNHKHKGDGPTKGDLIQLTEPKSNIEYIQSMDTMNNLIHHQVDNQV